MTKRKMLKIGLLVTAMGLVVANSVHTNNKIKEMQERVDIQQNMLYNKDTIIEDLNTKLKEQNKVINDLEWEKNHLVQEVEERSKPQVSRGSSRQIPVRVTHYSAEETGSNITASGEAGTPFLTLAYNGLPLGTHVRIDGREYIIQDRVGRDGVADIFVNSTAEALSLGSYDTVMEVIE